MTRRKPFHAAVTERLQPILNNENVATMKKGALWFGLGTASFFSALPGVDVMMHDIDARVTFSQSSLDGFYGNLSPSCRTALTDPLMSNADKSSRISALYATSACDTDAARLSNALDRGTSETSRRVAIGGLITSDIAERNAAAADVESKIGITILTSLGLVGMGAAAAIGLYKINDGVAGYVTDMEHRSTFLDVPPEQGKKSSRSSGLSRTGAAVASGMIAAASVLPFVDSQRTDAGQAFAQFAHLVEGAVYNPQVSDIFERPYVPLRAQDCWLKAHLTSAEV